MEKVFISTAIDYVNAPPHLGHALEKIQADVLARYYRSRGNNVLFLSGTDENSLKNVQAAKKEGISVKELVDKNAQKFYGLKSAFNLSFDDFIRTTEERHSKGAQKFWEACKKDIFKKIYKGLYCVGCEEFYKENELIDGLCPEHKTKPETIEEENYFFRLSKYQNQLKEIIKNDDVKIIPSTRKNEVLSFIESGLGDICISRSAERAQEWGVDVPGDNSQKMWVWFDALSSYINALGYGNDDKKFEEFWQKNNNIIHVIGKGILRFHAVYWIGMLLSAKLSLPKTIFVHGYITSGGHKMSKSIGNVIDPFELVEKYGKDAVRYFLMRETPSTEDGDFTYEKFEKRYNADLAGGLGNLLARVVTLAAKFNVSLGDKKLSVQFEKEIKEKSDNYRGAMDGFKFNEALSAVWELVGYCDKYIEQEQPWKERPGQKEAIADLMGTINEIAKLLQPFLPETAENIFIQLRDRKSEILFHRLN